MKKLSEYLKKPLCTCHWGKRFLYHNQIISVFHLPNSTYHSTVGAVSFNAFHVPIYLTSKKHHVVKRYFKYISCSYLSTYDSSTGKITVSFKYISCSYLSQQKFCSRGGARIQIHLMFLFIKYASTSGKFYFQFKYISCSYLSQ